MIGVVVWSNAPGEKAVIWCEDHAALAYLQGRDAMPARASWPQPGDLVELETALRGNLRHAIQVAPLGDHGRSHLPEMLRDAVPVTETHLTLVGGSRVVEPVREPLPASDRIELGRQMPTEIRRSAGSR